MEITEICFKHHAKLEIVLLLITLKTHCKTQYLRTVFIEICVYHELILKHTFRYYIYHIESN